ncbi:MAG: glycosyltransferase [Pirellulaceae bacterium]|nr:glycosyltransferase [Pirellulaceae bacterium]
MRKDKVTIDHDGPLENHALVDQVSRRRSSPFQSQEASGVAGDEPLRVMCLLTDWPEGMATHLVSSLMQRMDIMRFIPQLCCLREPGAWGEQIADRFQVNGGLSSYPCDLRVLPRLVRQMRNRVDVVMTVGTGDSMFWAYLAAKLSGVPVVLSVLDLADRSTVVNRLLAAWTDVVVVTSAAQSNFLRERKHFAKEKIRVIPLGIDPQKFVFDPKAPFAVRQQLGIPLESAVCGMVAPLRPEKKHRLFLEVARRILDEIPTTHFLVVGDGPEAERLKVFSARLQLAERVHFLGDRADIAHLLSSLNVFLWSSDRAGDSVEILAALSIQIPVVAAPLDRSSAWVKNGVTGFLAPPGDVGQLADFAVELIQDGALAHRVGALGRQEIIAHHSVDRMVRAYQHLILEVYHRKQSGGPPRQQESRLNSFGICAATP